MLNEEQLLDHLSDSHCIHNNEVNVEGGTMYYNLAEGEDCCCIIYPPIKDGIYSIPTLMKIFDDLCIAPPVGVLTDEYAVYQTFKEQNGDKI